MPAGEIVAVKLKCAWMGNRGVLHDAAGNVMRHHAGDRWIICDPDFKGRSVEQWAPGRYTVLFFYDEAVALAAGHRPCAQCRHTAYKSFLKAFPGAPSSAAAVNRQLHAERLGPLELRAWTDLPSGVFVVTNAGPALVLDDRIMAWTQEGYGTSSDRPTRGSVLVRTPPSAVMAIANGYHPQITCPEDGETNE